MANNGYIALAERYVAPSGDFALWFAVQTYARHEKRVASLLTLKGVDHYLPLVARMHRWSDRRKQVELPLFPCYLFVHIAPSAENLVQVIQADGVLGLVGDGKRGVPIPDRQIEDVRILLKSKINFDPYPFLKIGQRVRICEGSLCGVEGILVRRNGMRRLIVSVDTLARSFSVCVEGLEVEAI